MSMVRDHYGENEFLDILVVAEDEASGTWERTFVSDMKDKFFEYGLSMFLSEKQREILERIAYGE